VKIRTISAVAALALLCAPSSPRAEHSMFLAFAQTASANTVPPRIFFVDVESGPAKGGPNGLGVPISIFGKGFGKMRGHSRVTIGGIEVASYMVWGSANAHNRDLDMIVVQPGGIKKAGPIVVTVDGSPSNSDFSFTPGSGSVYYVALKGSDSKSCSEQSPCSTVTHALSGMKPGDVLLLRQGNYSEGEIWIRSPQAGTDGHPKIIKNYPGEEAVMSNAVRNFYVDADHITVSGLNFRNGKSLLVAGWASNDQRDNWFVNNTFSGVIEWAAIDMSGHDHLLAGNVCDVSGSKVGTMGHCYYVSEGSNFKILYNVGSGAPGYGLHIYDERRADKDFRRIIRDVLVEGNILSGSRERSGMVLDMTDAGGYGNAIENITIRNNIFFGNNQAGVVIKGVTHSVSIYNNTFYQNGREGLYIDNSASISGIDVRNNLFYESQNPNCSTECDMPLAHLQVGRQARNVTIAGNSYHPARAITIGISDASAVTGDAAFVNE